MAVARLTACVLLLAPPAAAAPDRSVRTGFRIVRVAAGPSGSVIGGQFVLDEERSTFSRRKDSQVIVTFRWEGEPGLHHLAGRWQGPAGAPSSSSEFDSKAPGREFGAYWSLPLTPSMPAGSWSMEATIDGVPAGRLAFEVVDDESPPPGSARRPLSPAEVYDRIGAVFVPIDRSTTRGRIDTAAGFVAAPGMIATAFAAVDAVDVLDVVAPDGGRQSVTSLAAWNRHQDWALLPVAERRGAPLPVAPPDSARIGDRCYSMESGSGGARLLTACSIVGRGGTPVSGERLMLSFLNGTGVPGAPVVNEYGEALGVVGGALSTGATRLDDIFRARVALGGVPLVPMSMLQLKPSGESASILVLRQRSILVPAVHGDENVSYGGFARGLAHNPVRAQDPGVEFPVGQGSFIVFLNWSPKERVRGMLTMRGYDEENRPVMESKPGKVDFFPRSSTYSYWELPVPSRAGVYRIDAVLDATPIWREFLRVTP